MLNQLVIVGRLVESKKDGESLVIKISVPKPYKNEDDIYENDIVPITLKGLIANNTEEWVKEGDIIGIKGRIETNNIGIEIVGEKVTFLSNKSGKVD